MIVLKTNFFRAILDSLVRTLLLSVLCFLPMQYRTFLKHGNGCPFCAKDDLDRTVIVKENRRAMITVAKAPYVPDQLLVITKRHIERFSEMNLFEAIDCFRLIKWAGERFYYKGHPGFNTLLRDGDRVGKSIPHLHIHLIPNLDIDMINGSDRRKMLTPLEINRLVKKLQG